MYGTLAEDGETSPPLQNDVRRNWFQRNTTFLLGGIIALMLVSLGVTVYNSQERGQAAQNLRSIWDMDIPLELETKHSLFKRFKRCLIREGVDSANIVRRRENSKAYNWLNYQWQSGLRQIYPLAYVLPLTELDVAAAVTCGQTLGVRVVPKSGGNSFEKYSFADKHSVVVDLQMMDEVKQSGMTISLGPGILPGPASIELWNSGKVFIPAGVCPTVGIGVALGGGDGFFSRHYGLTTDNILEMNIATATRGLITVNKDTHSDLYWALRGAGGGNFGIVTKFVLRLHPAPPTIFVGTLIYPLDSFQKFFAAFQTESATLPRHVALEVVIAGGIIETIFVDHTGSSSEFKTFEQALPKSQARSEQIYSFPDFIFYQAKNLSQQLLKPSVKFESASDYKNVDSGSAEKAYLKVKSFYVKNVLKPKGVAQLNNVLKEQPETVAAVFLVYGGAVNDLSTTDTAFVHRDGTKYVAVAQFQSAPNASSSQIATARSWLEKYFEMGKHIFNSKESYQNYADGEMSDYLERYYGHNLPRLVKVKRKYDPDNYFHFPQSIPI